MVVKVAAPFLSIAPVDSEFEKIIKYFSQYCALNNLDQASYTGALYKTSKVDIIRVFVAAMLHLYYPGVFHCPVKGKLYPSGFLSALSDCLGQKKSNTSVMIREVIQWEKDYSDFKEKVDLTLQQLQLKVA